MATATVGQAPVGMNADPRRRPQPSPGNIQRNIEMDINGKTIVITGGGQGLGRVRPEGVRINTARVCSNAS